MKLTFLGTASSTPTKDRNLSAMLLNFEGENFLFDCPEGTQRQLMKAKESYMKISKIFITHLHADHLLGLPGLIATMSIHERDSGLKIFGPKGIREKVDLALRLGLMKQSFELKCIEVTEGKILEEEKYSVKAVKLKHDVPCFGYIFEEKGKPGEFNRKKAEELGIPVGPLYKKLQQGETVKVKGKIFKPEDVMNYSKAKKGRKISYITDTYPDKHYFEAIEESDVLVHESTFLDKLKSRAKKTLHSTAKEVGKIAEKTKCKKLYLIHLSSRHKDSDQLENEARMEFANAFAAKDLMEVKL